MSENVGIISSVMEAITQTDEWECIMTEDPQIVEAEKRVRNFMNAIRPLVPKKLWSDLYDSVAFIETAYTDAAILYGINVAQTIQAFASNSAGYSAHCLEIIRKAEVTA